MIWDATSARLLRSALPAALALALGVTLAGCGSSSAKSEPVFKPTVTLPTGHVSVPSGVTLTKAGTKLAFGESAQVPYEPNAQRNTVLQLTVVGVRQGRISDLGSYILDDRTKASTPYYVSVKVKNVGSGDVGTTPVPLWAVDSTNTLVQASSFTNSFGRCASTPLPASFPPNAETTTCLVYLVPNHGTLTGVSYRPLQAFAPIVWKGAVTPPPALKAPGKKKKAAR